MKKTVTIFLALGLISSFFLPYLQFESVKASGFDLLVATTPPGAKKGLLLMKYIWLLIPVASIFLLIGALNNERYFLSRAIWALLPLLTLSVVCIQIFRDAKRIGIGTSFNELSKNLAIGFWTSLGLSLVLAFYWPGKKE
jgi:hypothetical protein